MNPDFIQLIVTVIVAATVVFNIIGILRNRKSDRIASEAQAIAGRSAAALERIANALEARGRA
jgi:hypothetical protein